MTDTELPVDVWLIKNAKTLRDIQCSLGYYQCKQQCIRSEQECKANCGQWVSVPEIQPHLTKLVQERDDNKLLVIQAVTKLRAKEEELEGKILIDRKQLSDHLKKFPSDTSFLCPDCGKFIETTPSFKQQVWFKGLKELLEK